MCAFSDILKNMYVILLTKKTEIQDYKIIKC